VTELQKRAMCMAVQLCLRDGMPITTSDISGAMIRQGMDPGQAATEAVELLEEARRIVEEEAA